MAIFSEFKELYRYRELLRNLVARDIKKRYKRSALGFLWVMLDPLLTLVIYYVVFAGIFGKSGNYKLYIISGVIMWQLLAQGTRLAGSSFTSNRQLINKIYLPKSIFPIATAISSLMHFGFSLVPLLGILIFSGINLNYHMVMIPLVIFLAFTFSLGIALLLATLTVFFRDVKFIYDAILRGWMFLSAIFYPISILPEKFQVFMLFNPMYNYISIFRALLYDVSKLRTEHVYFGIASAFLSFSVGWIIYQRNKDRLIFYL
ncbi:MAG: ABC transporter permease [Dissulfurispiraceae bacterium]